MKRLLVTGLTTAALAGSSVLALAAHPATAGSPIPSASLASATDGTYVPVTPTRLLDTRPTGKLAPGATTTVQITGKAAIPTRGVSAAVVNLTVTGATKPGFLSAYPGTTFPGTSALNFAAGETRANLVTVPVSDAGTITVLNGATTGAAPANVLLDVQGYYLDDSAPPTTKTLVADSGPAPARFDADGPYRLVDSREEEVRLAAGDDYYVQLYYFDGEPDVEDPSDITAMAVNVTAVSPSGPGYFQAWNGDGEVPSTSILNFAKGRTTPNNAVVPVATYTESDGEEDYTVVEFAIHNGSTVGSADFLIDLLGTYSTASDGLVFRPLDTPVRMVDTRSGKGTTRLSGPQTKSVQSTDEVLNPAQANLTSALVGNLTAVRPTAATYLTVWPQRQRPDVSNLNPVAGQTVANHAYVGLTPAGKFNIYNATGSTDVLLDVTGRFDRTQPDKTARSAPTLTTPSLRPDKVELSRHRHAR